MKHFAVELRRLADSMTLNALADASGVARTSLSNYTSMRARPSPKHLKAICDALPEPDRARLAAAHLMDERPDSAKHLVEIGIKIGKSTPKDLGSDATALLSEIERMMLADPSFSQWLAVTIGMMRS
ncbi:helix-turn-helix transcriptional regulator [Verrucomicrobium sp. BvORR106]|uniref:helix-turn-helix domain-containing protein n=1 Tax=Verrucomicrobium sp. BvORR106 TaxID=1403819 RepID=UPI000570B2F5|nr:helix-turn-helix transcriptional regulator [Verrucomicrobium sp. BvORR106]